jgi:hypothetical protein
MQFVLEVVILACSFLKHSRGILGINLQVLRALIYVYYSWISTRNNSYLTNYGQNVQLWTFGMTMVTFTCVIL